MFHKEVEFSDSGSFLTPLKDIISESSDNEEDETPVQNTKLIVPTSPEKRAKPLFTRTKKKNPAVESKINRIFQGIREN